MSDISEDSIVKAILNQEQSALGLVLDKYGNLIKSVINKHMNLLPMYHEECFNDVLLAIWYNIQQYDKDKSSLKNWIAAIARYKSISYIRSHIKEIATEDIDATFNIADETAQIPLLQQEHDAEFEQLICGLKDRDKELFRRIYLYDQDVGKISGELGLSVDVIYNRLSRGKKKLRLILGGKGE